MFHVSRMYSEDQWQFAQTGDVIEFLYTDEVHHNDSIIVEQHEFGVRAWIGTDFLQKFEDSDTVEDEDTESWAEFDKAV